MAGEDAGRTAVGDGLAVARLDALAQGILQAWRVWFRLIDRAVCGMPW
jgi:hypothetical protein